MKKAIVTAAIVVLLFTAQFSYAGGSSDNKTAPTAATPAVSGLLSLDQAIEAAVTAIEGRVAAGSQIAVYKITASHDEIGDFIAEDLSDRISMRGKLIPLFRGSALQYVDTEQMSGLVSDASAVGIGRSLGAKAIITGTFDRYADFSQLRLRAIDVGTSALLYSYTARVNNSDRVLANISAPHGDIQAPRITENALAYLNRGKDLVNESKYDEAITEFDRAIALNNQLVEAYFYRGSIYDYKGNYDQAINDFNQTILLDPNYAVAYNNRGVVYYKKGEYDRALADYDHAIRLDPNSANRAITYQNRGVTYVRKGEYDRALADYDHAIRLDPDYTLAYYARGVAYNLKGDFNQAIKDFETVLRRSPNHTGTVNSLADSLIRRGMIHNRNGEYDRAISDFNQVLELNIKNASLDYNSFAYNNRGISYKNKGNLDQAIADFEVALRLDPNNPGTRQNLVSNLNERAVAYFNRSDFDKALADTEAALRLDPNDPYARQNLEVLRRQMGR